MNEKMKIGAYGEEIATKYLQKHGYEIIRRNFNCYYGEIDIIAKDKQELIFLEVKTRTNMHYGRPIEAIDEQKQKHLRKAINCYLYQKNIKNIAIRIDAIEVFLEKDTYNINHLKQIL